MSRPILPATNYDHNSEKTFGKFLYKENEIVAYTKNSIGGSGTKFSNDASIKKI